MKFWDLIAGIALLGFSGVYYFSQVPKETFFSNPFLPLVFIAAAAVLLIPSNPKQKNFVGQITRDNFALVALKWLLAFYLIYIALGGFFEVPLPSLLSIKSGYGMFILTLIGIFELAISFRR